MCVWILGGGDTNWGYGGNGGGGDYAADRALAVPGPENKARKV